MFNFILNIWQQCDGGKGQIISIALQVLLVISSYIVAYTSRYRKELLCIWYLAIAILIGQVLY